MVQTNTKSLYFLGETLNKNEKQKFVHLTFKYCKSSEHKCRQSDILSVTVERKKIAPLLDKKLSKLVLYMFLI